MKRLILSILFILCLSFQASAWNIMVVGSGKGTTPPAGCGGTLTFVGNPGDTETFEFEAGDFCCTEFSETDPDTIISTYNQTQVKNGSYAAQLNFSGVNQNDNYISVDLGVAGDTDFTIDFWVWVSDVDDNEGVNIFYLSDTTAGSCTTCVSLYWLHAGTGVWQLRIYGDADSETSSNLTTEAWYRIEIDFNLSAATTAEIYNSSDVLQGTITATGYGGTVRYPWWGHAASDADATVFYIDDVRYKSGGGGF